LAAKRVALGSDLTIIVTHEMNFARQVANRILFKDGGIFVEEDVPDRSFGSPRASRAP
jgi:polar amino acid transport system ATP-binding protein